MSVLTLSAVLCSKKVSADLIDDLEVGDYVMVHAGVAIAKITSDDSEETDEIMESIQ